MKQAGDGMSRDEIQAALSNLQELWDATYADYKRDRSVHIENMLAMVERRQKALQYRLQYPN
jgi:hypothetical protein